MPELIPFPFASQILDNAATFTTPKTFATNQATTDPLWKALVDPAFDTQSDPFYFHVRSFDFSGTRDAVARLGWNVTVGGSAANPSRGMIDIEFEQRYLSGAGLVAEGHWAVLGDGEITPQRYISIFANLTGAKTVNNNQLAFFAMQSFHREPDSSVFYWYSDATSFRTINRPLSTVHTDTGARHLELNGPAGMTVHFMRALKNNNELIGFSEHGELNIDGNASPTGSGRYNAMINARGRPSTNSIIRLADSDNVTKLLISGGTGHFNSFITKGQLQHSGPFSVYDTNGSTRRLHVNELGTIRTNQISAGGPAGAVGAKLAITDEGTGTVWYIDLKALT